MYPHEYIHSLQVWKCGSRDVCIGVQSKHLWAVHQRQLLNELSELLNALALRDAIALVEGKGLREHVVSKPHLHMIQGRVNYTVCIIKIVLIR